jgi:phosphoglucosamine mutase
MVDDQGELVDGDQLLYVLAMDRARRGALCGGVVGTLMSNFGLELAFNDAKIPFHRAGVGDRYVMEALDRHGWSLGGESSGHIVCLDRTSTGDGIVSALQVLSALITQECSLREALAGLKTVPQVMINVRGPNRTGFMQNEWVIKALAEAEQQLAGRGRVLLRPSGTEPLVRVMVEGEDPVLVEKACRTLADVVTEVIA